MTGTIEIVGTDVKTEDESNPIMNAGLGRRPIHMAKIPMVAIRTMNFTITIPNATHRQSYERDRSTVSALNMVVLAAALAMVNCATFLKPAIAQQAKSAHASANGISPIQSDQSRPALKKFTTVGAVIDEYGNGVRLKLKPIFEAQNVAYPPKELTWIAFKKERMLQVFARDRTGNMRGVLAYPIIGTSGVAGPKLKEGDKQVPEGFYKVSEFRPNIIAHIGLEVDYPNAEDRAHAKVERRKKLGGDILIHGSQWSTGCLAMGNEPIEELFVLAFDAGYKNIRLIFAPCNLVAEKPDVNFDKQPKWLPDLYARLRSELKNYPIKQNILISQSSRNDLNPNKRNSN